MKIFAPRTKVVQNHWAEDKLLEQNRYICIARVSVPVDNVRFFVNKEYIPVSESSIVQMYKDLAEKKGGCEADMSQSEYFASLALSDSEKSLF